MNLKDRSLKYKGGVEMGERHTTERTLKAVEYDQMISYICNWSPRKGRKGTRQKQYLGEKWLRTFQK